MFAFIHRLLGGKRTPQDTQWPRPLPQMTLRQDPDAYRCPMPDPAQKEAANAFLAKHGLSLDSKLSDAVCGESEFYKRKKAVAAKNFTKTPEQRKADHAKSVATKALKKARTDQLRRELRQSVEEA